MSSIPNESAGNIPARTAKANRMSATVEARKLFIDIAGPVHGSGWVSQAIEVVHAATGLPRRRLLGIWGREARRIDAEEMDALRAAAKKQTEEAHALIAISARLSALEARLATIDSEFHRESIAALGRAAGRVRRVADD